MNNFSYTFNYKQAGNAVGRGSLHAHLTDANGNGTYQTRC